MKKLILLFFILGITIQCCAQLNWGSLAEKLTGDSTKSSTISGALGNILATDKVEVNQLIGTWNYESPAVGFQSKNILKKAGASVASAKIESELKGYYAKAGLDKLVLTIAEDNTFSMKTKYATLKGAIEKGENGFYIFNFKAFGKVKIGKLNAYTTISGSTLSLTFDIKKLIKLVKMVSQYSSDKTFKGVMSLVDSYDGITAGFKLKKQ